MLINIDSILKRKGKSRYWLSNQIKMTYPNLKRLCDNNTSSISFEILEQICTVLNCTPNDILIFEESKNDADSSTV